MSTVGSTTTIVPAPLTARAGAVDETVKSWIDALNDDSGSVSNTDKAAALAAIQKSWTSLSGSGSSQATKDYVNAGMSSSSYLAKANSFGNAMNAQIADLASPAKATATKSSAVFQSMLDYFDKLSADDQVALASSTGVKPDDWRATTQAQLKLSQLFETAQGDGDLGADGRPTVKASAALKTPIVLSDQFDKMEKVNNVDAVNAWTRQVGSLVGGSSPSPAVRIDLSDNAKAYLAAKAS